MGTWAGEQGFVDLPMRQVFATGLAADAAAMIIAHNHPSGDPTPGPEDLRTTRELARIGARSEEHTSELQSLMRISYAVFCLKKKKYNNRQQTHKNIQKYTNN